MAAASTVTTIDGAFGEGGGQILRNSAAYSMLYKVPVRIENIRANRPGGGGLRPQHVAAIRTVAQLGNGSLTGDEAKNREVDITPGDLMTTGDVVADPGTAGSTMLLAQAVLPVLVCTATAGAAADPVPTPVTLTLRGGTSQTMAPPVEFFQLAFLPLLARLTGVQVGADLTKRGYVPKGGGEITLTITDAPPGHSAGGGEATASPALLHAPAHLPDWHFSLDTPGSALISLQAHVSWTGLGVSDGASQILGELDTRLAAAAGELGGAWGEGAGSSVACDPPTVLPSLRAVPSGGEEGTLGHGMSLLLVATDDAGNAWTGSWVVSGSGRGKKKGRRGKRGGGGPTPPAYPTALDEVWGTAVRALTQELRWGGCVDSHMADQLIVFAAMTRHPAPLRIRVGDPASLSDHARSAIYVANALTPHRTLEAVTGESGAVTIVSSAREGSSA